MIYIIGHEWNLVEIFEFNFKERVQICLEFKKPHAPKGHNTHVLGLIITFHKITITKGMKISSSCLAIFGLQDKRALHIIYLYIILHIKAFNIQNFITHCLPLNCFINKQY